METSIFCVGQLLLETSLGRLAVIAKNFHLLDATHGVLGAARSVFSKGDAWNKEAHTHVLDSSDSPEGYSRSMIDLGMHVADRRSQRCIVLRSNSDMVVDLVQDLIKKERAGQCWQYCPGRQ